MIDSRFRNPYQRWIVEPILKTQAIQRFSPNTLTLFACLFGISILPLLALHYSHLALAALIMTGFLDTLDGSLARHLKTTSPKGTVFDITSDRLVEFSIILGLYAFDPTHRALGTLLMLGSVLICVTSFLVVGIFEDNQTEKGFHYSPGIMERAEAFLFFGAMILFPSYFMILAILFTSLVFLTAVIRLRQFAHS